MKRLLFALLIVTVFSCKKDEKEETAQTNANLCDNVICSNGGICINGVCQCAQGYTGPNCNEAIIPSGFTITKVKILNFPQTDNGAGWDLTSGPDLYVAYGSTCCFGSTNWIQNAIAPSQFNVSWTSSSIYGNFTIWLLDFDDFDADDTIAGISFIPVNYSEGLPDQITVSNSALSVQLDINWAE